MSSVFDLYLLGDTAPEAVRRLAIWIWRRDERATDLRSRFRLKGLNSERAVRRRLSTVAGPFEHEFPWRTGAPKVLLERTEALLTEICPGDWEGPEALVRCPGVEAETALHLLLIQSIAARLGVWKPSRAERSDGALAKALYDGLGDPEFGRYRRHLADAARFERQRRLDAALRLRLEADRLVRTAENLVRAAVCAHRCAEPESALWCLRAAFLEPGSSFGGVRTERLAERLHRRLAASFSEQEEEDVSDEILVCSQDLEVTVDASPAEDPSETTEPLFVLPFVGA